MTSPSDLKKAFDRFDKDSNGSIDEEEFASLLGALGVTFTEEQVMTAFLAIDVNGNRRIDFGEFCTWWDAR